MTASIEKPRRLNLRMQWIFRVLFTLCVIGSIIFIYSNSMEIGIDSGNKSKAIMEFLNLLLEKMQFGFRLSEHRVRKLAHFAEYMMLGFWLMLSLRVYTHRVVSFISWPLLGGLLVAVTDEFLQTFIPGRSGQVRDVVIDFSGVLAGLVVGLTAILIAAAIWDAFRGKR